MKVFISWSGTRSKALATALRQWLPLVLQYAEPWVSDKDISAGDRWAQAIAGELETSNFGIICITPENVSSPWILFEAGALSKSMLDAKVIPLLFGLELSDLSGPLSQFQAQKVEEAGLMEVIRAVNKVADNKASDEIIAELVPTLWPKLQAGLAKIPNKEPSERHARSQQEILEELVTDVRGLNSRMRDFDPEITSRELRNRKRRSRWLSPMLFEEVLHVGLDSAGDPASLLLIASLLRNDIPWLAEIILESYREIRDGNAEDAQRVVIRLQRTIKTFLRRPFIDELSGDSREDIHMLAMELPRVIDRSIRPILEAATSSDESGKGGGDD